MTAPTTSAGPIFVCPECESTEIGEWRNEVTIYDVVAWNDDGTPAKLGEELSREDDGPVVGPTRYMCACGATFGEPARIEEAAHV